MIRQSHISTMGFTKSTRGPMYVDNLVNGRICGDCNSGWMNEECGIETGRVHGRNDWHSSVQGFLTPLPILDQVYGRIMCLPVGWWLTDEDLEYVVECILKGW